MKRYLGGLSVLLAGVVGALLTLLVVGTGGTKTVTVASNGATSSSGGSSSSVPSSYSKSSAIDVNGVYKKDINGVVDITVVSKTSSGYGTSSEEEGEGAGVVYDKQGDIITDEHVVAGATSVKVNFENGKSYTAKVVGSDASSDVAVVKVDAPASELQPIAFADSSKAAVGDPVVAIGSPFGLPGTVTQGIVSAVGRPIQAPNNYTISGSIQTDAAINPGNSGGPLLDADGQVLGLNDQIETEADQNAGVGFATPGNTDVQVANQIIAGKTVEHAYLGVCLNGSSTNGAAIAAASSGSSCAAAVAAGSPAAKAGLKAGDTITAINGNAVTSANSFITALSAYSPGQTVTLTVRRDGQTLKIKVTLANRPKTTAGG